MTVTEHDELLRVGVAWGYAIVDSQTQRPIILVVFLWYFERSDSCNCN